MGNEQTLKEHYPRRLVEADDEEIDYEVLANEIGRTCSQYQLPTTPDGDDRPWLDKLALSLDVARYIRDGGQVNVGKVLNKS